MVVMGRPKKDVSEENMRRFQKELEMADGNSDVLLADKKGRSRACLLCRRRKQKCDHKQPSCTTCLKANVKCIQPARYGGSGANSNSSSPTGSMSSSILRIKRVKTQGKAGGTSESGTPIGNYSVSDLPQGAFKPLEANMSVDNCASGTQSNFEYISFLENKIKTLESLVHSQTQSKTLTPTQAQPHLQNHVQIQNFNLGSSNGQSNNSLSNNGTNEYRLPTPTTNAQHNFTVYVNNSPLIKDTVPALKLDSFDSIDFSKCIFAKYNLKEFLNYDPVFEFNEILSRSFLDMFFNRLQFKYPLLDEQEIYSFHEDYIRNNIRSYSESGFHFACGRMWLVFSISACLCMTTGKYKGLPPVRYFSTAIRHITKCGQNLNFVQQIELLTLLLLYILRTDRDSSVLYDIIKDVMFIIKEKLGANQWNPNDPFANKRLRLFWCVYLLERMICVAVGRPFTIKESDINLPLFDENSFNTRSLTDTNSSQSQTRGVHFINQSLKLRRIESQFVEALNILPQRQNNKELLRRQLPLVNKFFQDLEIWRSSCSKDNVKNFENETLKLYYYRSVRLLIQPYLQFLTPENRLFRECQAAAGQICQLYKIFHQKTVTGHSTPAVHTVFVAGVTLIYCMWLARNNDDKRRKKLGDASKHTRPLISASLFSTMDDLRACSVCLYVMTERSKFARIFRDTFDQLMSATVGNLIERCGPDSSELILLSQSNSNGSGESSLTSGEARASSTMGMPPAVERIFGSRQAEEHVGFVEISQVDPEEQKELKKKQGVLEKTSVPRSLSHLLIKVDGDSQDGNHTVLPQNESTIDPSQKKNGRVAYANDHNDENQYIVKKPATSEEFDWRVFQQQALLQQHSARQNLQAYLSSLKYAQRQGDKSVIDKLKASIRSGNTASLVNVPDTSLKASHNGNNNTTQFSPPSTGLNTQVNENAHIEVNSSDVSCEQSILQALTPIVSSQNGSQENSPSSLSNGGVLFNNGTHDMINNISTWTKDSVANFLNDKVSFQDMFSIKEDETALEPHVQQIISYQQQLYHSKPQCPNPVVASSSTDDGAQNMCGSSNGFATTLNSNEGNHKMLPTVSEVDNRTGMLQGYQEQKKSQIQLPSTTSKEDKFWMINDDYGFLA